MVLVIDSGEYERENTPKHMLMEDTIISVEARHGIYIKVEYKLIYFLVHHQQLSFICKAIWISVGTPCTSCYKCHCRVGASLAFAFWQLENLSPASKRKRNIKNRSMLLSPTIIYMVRTWLIVQNLLKMLTMTPVGHHFGWGYFNFWNCPYLGLRVV